DQLYRRALELVRGEFEERTWQAVWLTVIEDRDPAAVAQELAMTPNTIRQSPSRVLRRLREGIGGLIDWPSAAHTSHPTSPLSPPPPSAFSCRPRPIFISSVFPTSRFRAVNSTRLRTSFRRGCTSTSSPCSPPTGDAGFRRSLDRPGGPNGRGNGVSPGRGWR